MKRLPVETDSLDGTDFRALTGAAQLKLDAGVRLGDDDVYFRALTGAAPLKPSVPYTLAVTLIGISALSRARLR